MPRLLFALALLSTSAASAQERAGVVTLGGSGGIDAALYSTTIETFQERLHDDGFEVDTGGLPRLPDGCHQECRSEERRARELDVLVVLTLEADAAGTPTHAVVSVIDALSEYTERDTIEGRDAALVAELVMVQAMAQRTRGRRPWISVTGRPEASFVSIDGRDVGLVPWEGEVEAGEREVRVHLPGYADHVEVVTAAPGHPIELEVELAVPRSDESVRRFAALGVGIPLVLTGLALTILGGTYATRAGECADPACRSGYVFGDTEGAALGIGLSSLLAGGVLVVVGAY